MDDVLLTELGQSQLTQATLGFEADDIIASENEVLNGFGIYEGECQGFRREQERPDRLDHRIP
jgi:hypothetical protein